MADLNKSVADKVPSYTGTFGNASRAVFSYTFASAAANDIAILGKIPKYSTVTGVTLYTADLGTGTTMDIGYRTAELDGTLTTDEDYWIDGCDTATAAAVFTHATLIREPVTFTEEIYITAKNIGAVATGKITVVVDYIYTNN